jgi:Carboxypeptidase regulatory-like domain
MFFHAARFRIGIFFVLSIQWTLFSYAQFSAHVQGTVTDPAGSVVSGATVTLTNTATNISSESITGRAGEYHFDNVQPGDYRVTVAARGFERTIVDRHVSTDEVAGVDITLTIGRSSVTVNITNEEQGLNPDETRIEYTLTAQDIDNMPLPDRATLTALRVAPGVVGTIETSGSTNTNIPIGQASPDARANGRPASSNVYLLDRIPITSTEDTGALNMIPNPDMLSEIALQTTTFSVENGATSSLQVDMTSKSGGNRFHGDFDMSYTSKPFEANPDFSAGLTPFHRRYFMGSIGGPIIKNHTFFFGSIQRIDNLSALGTQATGFSAAGIGAWATSQFPNVPFTKLFTYAPTGLANAVTSSIASDYYPADGSQKFGVTCGQPSSFNLPCNTQVTVTGLFNQSPAISGQQYNLRFDHSFHQDRDRIYFGYFGVQQNSQYIDPRPAFDTQTPSQSYYFSAGYSHIFTPSLTNQLNAGLNRFWGGGVGNPNYTIFPHGTLFSFQSDAGGVGFAGGPQESPDSPYIGADSKEHVFALRDYVTWIKNRHSFTFGFQTAIRNYWQNSSANYSRPYNVWFSDLLEMLQGKADEASLYTISASTGKWVSQVYGAEQNQFGAYIEDSWKIKPNLQLTIGIRWDDFGNPGEYGENAVPYSNTFLGTGPTLYTQLQGAYAKLVNQAFTNAQTWNFLPRAAFTWSPGYFRQKTVIRGGAGLYQDAINLNQITANLPTTTPVRLTLTLHDAAESGNNFFSGNTGQWTGISGVPGEPPPFAWTGTQGVTPPYGIPYPSIPVSGFTPQGLATGPAGLVYSSNMYGVDPRLKPQSTVIWNFGIEQEFSYNVVFGLNYNGSYSYNQFLQSSSYNNPPGSNFDPSSVGYVAPPWPAVGTINLIRNVLTSNYSALLVTAQQRKANFSWQASYLWSHALGNPGSGDNPSPFNAAVPYGALPIDVRNRFTFSGAYEVPGFKVGALRAATHGWTLGAIAIAQAGTPFTVYSSQDVNNDGNKDANNDLPNVVFQPGSGLHYGGFTHSQYIRLSGIFNGACGAAGSSGNLYDPVSYPLCPFQTVTNPNPGTLEGNEPYNAFTNPGYFDIDLNFQKKTELPWFSGEKSNLILRVEALNALNRANLNGFGSSIVIGSTSNFGQIQNAENPRIIQIGLRFAF